MKHKTHNQIINSGRDSYRTNVLGLQPETRSLLTPRLKKILAGTLVSAGVVVSLAGMTYNAIQQHHKDIATEQDMVATIQPPETADSAAHTVWDTLVEPIGERLYGTEGNNEEKMADIQANIQGANPGINIDRVDVGQQINIPDQYVDDLPQGIATHADKQR